MISKERKIIMEFFRSLGRAVGNAWSFVEEKNRRTAALNRIRAVISCEEKAAQRQYLALGRYYYNNLRDEKNAVTEAHCADLDAIEARLDAALCQLEKFYQSEGECHGGPCCEEIDLEGVQCLEESACEELCTEIEEEAQDSGAGTETPDADLEEKPAASDENDGLPFEG